MKQAFQIHPSDNVATLLDDAGMEPITVVQGGAIENKPIPLPEMTLNQPIKYGHKVAVAEIGQGQPVVKFGIPIGHATVPIRRGDWVHLHNCTSYFDERSATLDPASGAPTDTPYA